MFSIYCCRSLVVLAIYAPLLKGDICSMFLIWNVLIHPTYTIPSVAAAKFLLNFFSEGLSWLAGCESLSIKPMLSLFFCLYPWCSLSLPTSQCCLVGYHRTPWFCMRSNFVSFFYNLQAVHFLSYTEQVASCLGDEAPREVGLKLCS